MTLARQNTAIQQAQAGTAAWIPHLSIGEVQDQTRGNRPRPALLGRPGPTGPDRQPQGASDQLRHVDARMTLRCLKTLSDQESLRINQGVDFKW